MSSMLGIETRRGAYVALVVLTLIAAGLAILTAHALADARSGEKELRPATPTPLDGG